MIQQKNFKKLQETLKPVKFLGKSFLPSIGLGGVGDEMNNILLIELNILSSRYSSEVSLNKNINLNSKKERDQLSSIIHFQITQLIQSKKKKILIDYFFKYGCNWISFIITIIIIILVLQ